MKLSIAVLVFVLQIGMSYSCPVPVTSTTTPAAKTLAFHLLNGFMQCDPQVPLNDVSPCNTFAGRGLEQIYGLTDFKTASGYLSANAIADYLGSHSTWERIGSVRDEGSNLCAQALANAAYPVVASLKQSGHGHIALVLPGDPTISPSWGNIWVANSASFFYNNPYEAYVGEAISKAFRSELAAQASFYYRRPTLPVPESPVSTDAH